jgi:hypothetical protein
VADLESSPGLKLDLGNPSPGVLICTAHGSASAEPGAWLWPGRAFDLDEHPWSFVRVASWASWIGVLGAQASEDNAE